MANLIKRGVPALIILADSLDATVLEAKTKSYRMCNRRMETYFAAQLPGERTQPVKLVPRFASTT
jgi:hypothetical protein